MGADYFGNRGATAAAHPVQYRYGGICPLQGRVVSVNRGLPHRLADWFLEWRVPLRKFLLRKGVGSSADVDDIAQEVFLRLLRYDRSDLVNSPQAYLYQVATNVCAEWATRSSRRLPHKSEWLTDLVDTLYPETEVERESAHAELKRAIELLPPRCRDILRMHFDAGMSHDAIAKRLMVSKRVVRREMERAYAALRVTLDSDLLRVTPPPSTFGGAS